MNEGRRLLEQSERTANLYNKYKQRLTKRLPPSNVNEMISKVSTMRNTKSIGTGGIKTRKQIRKNKTKKRYRKHHKNNKKRV